MLGTAGLLLAGAWAFRPAALPMSDHLPRHVPRPVPRQAATAPPLPVPDAMSDSTPLTLVVETRVAGATRYALARVSLDGDEVLVCAPDGRIPAFATRDAALAWASRVLPRPRDPNDAAAYATLDTQLRDAPPLSFDLDAAYAWARAARRDGLSPHDMLGAWTVLAMSAQLPVPPRGDPMFMAFARGEGGDRTPTDEEALAVSLMKVDLVVALAQRQAGTSEQAAWPAGADVWSDADARRIARELERAIPAFAARLTDDVDGVERALTGGR
jgi:hypothetical protein